MRIEFKKDSRFCFMCVDQNEADGLTKDHNEEKSTLYIEAWNGKKIEGGDICKKHFDEVIKNYLTKEKN